MSNNPLTNFLGSVVIRTVTQQFLDGGGGGGHRAAESDQQRREWERQRANDREFQQKLNNTNARLLDKVEADRLAVLIQNSNVLS
jgi:hypothetical protein